eukprot:TRINITY_DN10162_c0_g1_i1.p1 TRINITY_DN10162_c0_g1~~TRINITY_DN10162_c0_g1_i1.p1  ORF type:complete len:360 (-),score=35.54 TRINITY_DN10162_c0_g1_i1:104-1183(-)
MGYVSTYILVCASDKTNLFTYFDLASYTYGSKFQLLIKISFFLTQISLLVSCLILCNNFLALALQTFFNGILPDYMTNPTGYFWKISIAATIGFPMALQRRMTSLIFFCLVSFACSIYLILAITVETFDPVLCDITSNLQTAFTVFKPEGIPETLSTCIFAYICHATVLYIFQELERRSRPRMSKILSRLELTVTAIYLASGVFGYLTFSHRPEEFVKSNGNIMLADYKGSIIMKLGSIFLAFSVLPSIVMNTKTSKDALLELIFPNVKEDSTRCHVFLTAVVITFGVLCAVFVSGIDTVIRFVGSTSGSFVTLIVPCIFYLKTHQDTITLKEKIGIWTIIISVLSLTIRYLLILFRII